MAASVSIPLVGHCWPSGSNSPQDVKLPSSYRGWQPQLTNRYWNFSVGQTPSRIDTFPQAKTSPALFDIDSQLNWRRASPLPSPTMTFYLLVPLTRQWWPTESNCRVPFSLRPVSNWSPLVSLENFDFGTKRSTDGRKRSLRPLGLLFSGKQNKQRNGKACPVPVESTQEMVAALIWDIWKMAARVV